MDFPPPEPAEFDRKWKPISGRKSIFASFSTDSSHGLYIMSNKAHLCEFNQSINQSIFEFSHNIRSNFSIWKEKSRYFANFGGEAKLNNNRPRASARAFYTRDNKTSREAVSSSKCHRTVNRHGQWMEDGRRGLKCCKARWSYSFIHSFSRGGLNHLEKLFGAYHFADFATRGSQLWVLPPSPLESRWA